MPTGIQMPALSPGMETATLVRWLVRPGDDIDAGTVLAEIETDKATLELEAETGGRVLELLAKAGSNVAVGSLVARLVETGELPSPTDEKPPETSARFEPRWPTPVQPLHAEDSDVSCLHRLSATPVARRVAGQLGVDLSVVKGSGPRGRILLRDVMRSSALPAATSAPRPTAIEPSIAPAVSISSSVLARPYDEFPLDGMRRTIARRLSHAKQTVPHFYLRRELRMEALFALRAQLNGLPDRQANPDLRISVNDLLIRAHALALHDVPAANACLAEDRILRFRHVDVAVAVSIEGGLITPVLREAERKSVGAISAEMRDFIARARARKLTPEEYEGGTTSLSNLGMYGVSDFDAILNPPQATILAAGACERRPIVDCAGTLVAGKAMTVSLSADHRVIDGAVAAELLTRLAYYIETPFALLA